MGEVFAGHYELVDLVGAGSSGEVWRAWDHRQQTYVCAKVMRQHDAAALVRLVREHSESLRHPHVLLPRAWAGAEERVLFAADLIRGGTVADLAAEQGPLPDYLVAQLVEQVLSALAAVHERGLVHRDVHAGKLLLEPTGSERPHCWLSGFAAASVGEPSEDLRQLGSVAAELCTGVVPDPMAGPGPTPAHVAEPFWSWIRRMTGHVDPATTPYGSAEQARAELSATGMLPRTWPATAPRVPDRLGVLPTGWAPDGPGAVRLSAQAGRTELSATGVVQQSAVAYEEIPPLPHVVPPVSSDLSDADVPDDDGFAELAELVPSDPAYADSLSPATDELSDTPPPATTESAAAQPTTRHETTQHETTQYAAAQPELAQPETAQPEMARPAPTDQPPSDVPAVGGEVGAEPADAVPATAATAATDRPATGRPVPDRLVPERRGQERSEPDPLESDPLEADQPVEPAQLANRAAFAPPAEPDTGDVDDQDDAEEFQPRPIRVPHPPRGTRQVDEAAVPPDRIVEPASGDSGGASEARPAYASQAPAAPSDPARATDPVWSQGGQQPGMWHTGEWMTGEWPARERSDAAGAAQSGRRAGADQLPPDQLPPDQRAADQGAADQAAGRATGDRALDALSAAERQRAAGGPPGPRSDARRPYDHPDHQDHQGRPDRPEMDAPPPDLPPLDLDEPEPARWRRVLLVLFAIVALVGASAGTWYLVMLYR